MIRALCAGLWVCASLTACRQAYDAGALSVDIVGDTIPSSLTHAPGDAERGRIIFAERERGHCVLCHKVEGLEAEFQGDVGPDLSRVGLRLSPSQLRLRLVDYQSVRPGALMPSYYRIDDLHQVGERYRGQPALTAQEIEDLIVYLGELGGADE